MSQGPVSSPPTVAPPKPPAVRRVAVVLAGRGRAVRLAALTGELGPALHSVGAADLTVAAAAAVCQVVRYVLLGHVVRRRGRGADSEAASPCGPVSSRSGRREPCRGAARRARARRAASSSAMA